MPVRSKGTALTGFQYNIGAEAVLSTRYDKNVYSIMNSLGRSTSPTAKELEFINRWTREYGFSTDIILEACERSSLATDRHRFEYAEGILSSWKNAGIHHKADIQQADATYQKKKEMCIRDRPSS